MSLAWLTIDLRPAAGLHVVPCDEAGDPLPGHAPEATCPCRPALIRDKPLDDPIISHREPRHPGANTRLDA